MAYLKQGTFETRGGIKTVTVETYDTFVGLNIEYGDGGCITNIDPGEALNLADAIRVAAYAAIENRKD
jgi:hypothetical protein